MKSKPEKSKAKKDHGGRLSRVGETLYRSERTGTYFFKGQIHGKEYTQSLHTSNPQEARERLAGKRMALGRVEVGGGSRITLEALTERYRATFKPGLARSTLKDKERILRHVLEKWPTGRLTPIARIRPSDCDLWLSRFDFGIPARNGYLWTLKDMFRMAVRDRALAENPAAHLKPARRKPSPQRKLIPSWEEFRAIIASVRAQRFNGHDAEESADFLEAQGLLGLGQAEIRSLELRDVDLERNRITVLRDKTDAQFTIPIYPDARALIEKRCALARRAHSHLFSIRNAKRALKNACERLGLRPYSQRSFRRMFVTHALRRGVDVKVIAKWQGHHDSGKLILDTYSEEVSDAYSQTMAARMKGGAA